MNTLGKRRTYFLTLAVTIVLLLIACLPLSIFGTQSYAKDGANNYNLTTDDLWSDVNDSFNAELMSQLLSALTGNTGATIDDVRSMINLSDVEMYGAKIIQAPTINANANKIISGAGRGLVVNLKGRVWHVTSLTLDNNDNVVATLMLKEGTESAVWNVDIDKNNFDAEPSNMYGSSDIRRTLLNPSGAFAEYVQGDFAETYLVQPKYINYQRGESVSELMSHVLGSNYPNEALTDVGNFRLGEVNDDYYNNGGAEGSIEQLAKREKYTSWGDDYIWLPSGAEAGMDEYVSTNTIWRMYGILKGEGWLRTGHFQYNDAVGFNSSAGFIDKVNTSHGVQPAIHLNLSNVATGADPEIWDEEKNAFKNDKIAQLYSKLTGGQGITLGAVADLIANYGVNEFGSQVVKAPVLNTNSGNGDEGIVITMKGKIFRVTSLTIDDNNNIVATLLLKDPVYDTRWFYANYLDNMHATPSNMYGSSAIRESELLGERGWQVDLVGAGDVGKQFTEKYLIQPKNISYQRNQTRPEGSINLPNEALGDVGGFYQGYDYYNNGGATKRAKYTEWGEDYVWIPSVPEAVGTDSIWQISTTQICWPGRIASSWLRSGNGTTYKQAHYVTGGLGNLSSSSVDGNGGLRPALHLNLSAIALGDSYIPDNPEDVETGYNGVEDELSAVSALPNWYDNIFYGNPNIIALSYYRGDDTVTDLGSVRNAGEYWVKAQLTPEWIESELAAGRTAKFKGVADTGDPNHMETNTIRWFKWTIKPKEISAAYKSSTGSFDYVINDKQNITIASRAVYGDDLVFDFAYYDQSNPSDITNIDGNTLDVSTMKHGSYVLTLGLTGTDGADNGNYILLNGDITQVVKVTATEAVVDSVTWQQTQDGVTNGVGAAGSTDSNPLMLQYNGKQWTFDIVVADLPVGAQLDTSAEAQAAGYIGGYFNTSLTNATNGATSVKVRLAPMDGYIFRLGGDIVYYLEFTLHVNIAKLQITQPKATGATYTFDNTEQTLDVADFDSVNVSVSGNTGINAGGYKATFALNDKTNTEWVGGKNEDVIIDWTIATMKIARPTDPKFEYNGNEQKLQLTDKAWITASGDLAGTNAGEYNVTFSLNAPDNTEWVGGGNGAFDLVWNIAKMQIDADWDTSGDVPRLNLGSLPDNLVEYTISNAEGVVTEDALLPGQDYTVTAQLTEEFAKNYGFGTGLGTEVSKPFTTAKLELDVPTIKGSASVVYDKAAHTFELEGLNAEYMAVTGELTQTNADNYSVTISLKDGAIWSDTKTTEDRKIEFFITKKQITQPKDSGAVYTYDTEEQTFTPNDFDEEWTTASGDLVGTNAGNYTARYELIDIANTEWVGGGNGEIDLEWNIAKQQIVSDWDTSGDVPRLNLGSLPNDAVTYKVTNADGEEVPEDALLPGRVYTITAQLTEEYAKNYGFDADLSADVSKPFTTDKLELDVPTIKGSDSVVYDKAAHTFELEGLNAEYMVVTGELTQTNADNYSVTISLEDGAIWSDTKTSEDRKIEFFITKKQLTKPTDNGVIYTYDTEEQTFTPSGYDAEWMTASGNTATNVGKYTATIGLVDTDNTEWTEGGYDEFTLEWNIVEAKYNLSGVKWSTSQFEYDTTNKIMQLTGLPEGLSVEVYTGHRNMVVGDYVAEVVQFKNANSNYITPKPSDPNSYEGEFEFTKDWKITKHIIDLKWELVPYGDIASGLPIIKDDPSHPISYANVLNYTYQEVDKDGNVIRELSGREEIIVGLGAPRYYKITAQIKSESIYVDNYEFSSVGDKSYSIALLDDKIPVTVSLDNNVFTYNGSAVNISLKCQGLTAGDLVISYYDAQGQRLPGAPTNAGSYRVKVELAEDKQEDYYLASDSEFDFTIAKVKLSLEGVSWGYDAASPFVYGWLGNAAEVHTVTLNGLNEYLTDKAVYVNNTSSIVGDKTAGVTFNIDTNNYEFDDPAAVTALAKLDWKVIVRQFTKPITSHSQVFDNQQHALADFAGLDSGWEDYFDVTFEKNNDKEFDSVNAFDAGIYKVKFVIKSVHGRNISWATESGVTDITPKTTTVTIEQREVIVNGWFDGKPPSPNIDSADAEYYKYVYLDNLDAEVSEDDIMSGNVQFGEPYRIKVLIADGMSADNVAIVTADGVLDFAEFIIFDSADEPYSVTLPNTSITLEYDRNRMQFKWEDFGGIAEDVKYITIGLPDGGFGVGTHIVTVRIKSTQNAQWSDGTRDELELNIEIVKGKIDANWNNDTPPELIFGDETDELIEYLYYNGAGTVVTEFNKGETYTAKASIRADYAANYGFWVDGEYRDTVEKEFTIPSMVADPPTLIEPKLEYNGEEQTFEISGLDSGFMSITGELTQTNAGKYSITISLTNGAIWADGTTGDITLEFEITKKKLAVPTLGVNNLVYNGNEQTFTPNGFDDKWMTKSGNIGKNAGSYNAVFALKDKSNTEWADGTVGDTVTIEWEIDKLKVDVPTAAGEYTFTGAEQAFAAKGVDDKWVTRGEGNKGTNAGRYRAEFTLKDPLNTEWNNGVSDATISIEWEIDKFQINATWNKDGDLPKLTGLPSHLNENEVVYTFKDAAGNVVVKDKLLKGKEYTVEAKLSDKAYLNYGFGSELSSIILHEKFAFDGVIGGIDDGNDGGIADNMPLWQVIVTAAGLLLGLVFFGFTIANASKTKRMKKAAADSKASQFQSFAMLPIVGAISGDAFWGISVKTWTILAIAAIAFSVIGLVSMLVTAYFKSVAADNLEKAEREKRDNDMKMLFMMMNKRGGSEDGPIVYQSAPPVQDVKEIVTQVVAALMPNMQAQLPPTHLANNDAMDKIIDQQMQVLDRQTRIIEAMNGERDRDKSDDTEDG